MGQGLYTLLGYGVLSPPQLEDDDAQDTLVSSVTDLKCHTSYETDPDYLVIPLAVNDDWLQEWWKLPDLPDMLPHPKPRTARILAMDPAVVTAMAQAGRTDLEATWHEAKRLYAEAGLRLGEPSVIVLNDWD